MACTGGEHAKQRLDRLLEPVGQVRLRMQWGGVRVPKLLVMLQVLHKHDVQSPLFLTA
ncbi:hypothetical protein [Mumia zhuanghuii]|uniref:hypothetical protein n=1 Tax=Mumia zhuanghuii TaxID=2585211 RepID=UPI00129C4BD0|nr:hypothetical protein [Mumia zhuanghuii]